MIAGIDLSTHAVDLVLLEEDTNAATRHRFPLHGHDAFQRTRSVRAAMPGPSFWEETVACGIEEPRGHGNGALLRVQGAILACLPAWLLVQPLIPSEWRKACGLGGNCSKAEVSAWVHRLEPPLLLPWPQDACDAYGLAYATRSLLHRTEEAA